MMDEFEHINWIHPDLMEDVKRWCPDNVEQINDYTYEVFGATFVLAGQNRPVTVGAMIFFLMDNGWEQEAGKREGNDDG